MPSRRLRSTHFRGHATRATARERAIRSLVPLTWGYVAVSVVACLVLWTLADRWWPATLLLFGPRWILLLPLAALVPAAVVLRPSLLVPLGSAAIIVLVPIMGLRVGWRSWFDGDTALDLRVVTLNTGASEALALELPFRIRDWNADIVALQECGPAMSAAVRRISGWHPHVAGQLCLLSRHAIRSARSTEWSDLAPVQESGLGGSTQAAEYLIDAPKRQIRLVNVHLETARKGLEGTFELDFRRIGANTTLRASESRRTRTWLGDAEPALIVAGDFNMPVESSIYREHWSDLRNAFSVAGVGFGTTRDNGWIQVRIDHIATGVGWRSIRATVGPVMGLDHRPVIVDLQWAGPASIEAPRHEF